MQVKINSIPNEQFLDLAILYVEMNKVLSEYIPAAPALYNLTHDLATKPNFMALGLYEDEQLNGFVTGYALSEKTFYFSGIYVKIKNKNVKLLIEESFKQIDELGFTRWEADCNNEHIASILAKYGATPMYTRFKKEN